MLSILKLIYYFKIYRPRSNLLDSVSSDFRVKPWDLDLNIHLNNAKYLKYMDSARLHHGFESGFLKKVLTTGFSGVVANIEINYLRSIQPFQTFTINTRITGWDHKYVYLSQNFLTQKGQKSSICASALVRIAILKDGKSVSTEQAFEEIGFTTCSPQLPDAVYYWSQLIQALRGKTTSFTSKVEENKKEKIA